jgi:hypothetical protein
MYVVVALTAAPHSELPIGSAGPKCAILVIEQRKSSRWLCRQMIDTQGLSVSVCARAIYALASGVIDIGFALVNKYTTLQD